MTCEKEIEIKCESAINYCNFSPEDDKIILLSNDNKVQIQTIPSNKQIRMIETVNKKEEKCKIQTCNFNKNYSKLVLGGKNEKVTV